MTASRIPKINALPRMPVHRCPRTAIYHVPVSGLEQKYFRSRTPHPGGTTGDYILFLVFQPMQLRRELVQRNIDSPFHMSSLELGRGTYIQYDSPLSQEHGQIGCRSQSKKFFKCAYHRPLLIKKFKLSQDPPSITIIPSCFINTAAM